MAFLQLRSASCGIAKELGFVYRNTGTAGERSSE
jgi:hypothetical protein